VESTAAILIVDADANIASLLAELLTEEGYGVRVAKTAERVIAMAAQATPALILLDLHLVDVAAAELIDRLRTEGVYDGPILAMSTVAKVAPAVARRGATAFLAKPFDIAALLSIVRELLESSRCASAA
jgi:two-component system KDP operon response regulator KdpE